MVQNQSTIQGLPYTVQDVVAVLDRHRDEIASVWTLLGLQTLHAPDFPTFSDRKGWTVRILAALSEALGTGNYQAVDELVSHAAARLGAQGVDIGQVILTWVQGRTAALIILRRAYPDDAALILECISQLDQCLNYCTALYSRKHADQTMQYLCRQREREALILDMIQTAASTLELDHVFRRVGQEIARVVGGEECGFFLVDEAEGTIFPRFEITVPKPLRSLPPEVSENPSRPEPLQAFSEFLRQVIEEKKPLACYNVQTDSRFDGSIPRLMGVRSVLAVPFVNRGRIVAVAYAQTVEECRAFGEEEIELVCGMANMAAIAIENAQLHQQVKEQAICEERERLAQEMHDDLSQTLATVNWRTATLERLLAHGDVDQARALIQELKEIAKQGYSDIRESIFALRSASSLDSEFLPALQQYLTEYRNHTGLDVDLVFDTLAFPHLSVEVRLQLIRIIQEALSNIHKHADASRVQLAFQHNDGLSLSIEDDGCGFDPIRAQVDKDRYGLSIMSERAVSAGGSLSIDSAPGQGTRLLLWLPLPQGEERTL